MRRTVLLLTALTIAVLLASGVALVTVYEPAHAAFPGKNGKIAFSADWGDGNLEIYAINPDGSGQVNLTNNPAPDFTPEWSPDGSKIVFYRNLGLAPRQDLDVFVMNADGSGQTNLTKNSGPDDFHPSWSPDGEKIVFGSNRENSLDLYIMNADGTDVTRLTNNSQINFAPAWSPDGKKIAFTSVPRDDDNNRDIHVINVDGGGETNLTNDDSFNERANWSPDGNKIVFTSNRDRDANVYVMNADGTNPVKLTTSSNTGQDPAWSPDGKKIAYQWAGGGLSVINADGSGFEAITPDRQISEPDWQPLPGPTGPQTKADCKKGGWKEFGFKNQGQCIASLQREQVQTSQ